MKMNTPPRGEIELEKLGEVAASIAFCIRKEHGDLSDEAIMAAWGEIGRVMPFTFACLDSARESVAHAVAAIKKTGALGA